MALLIAFNRYRGGVTTYLEVVTAQNAALVAERTAVDLLTRRMIAAVLVAQGLERLAVSKPPASQGHSCLLHAGAIVMRTLVYPGSRSVKYAWAERPPLWQ